jgi:hypothetical protein
MADKELTDTDMNPGTQHGVGEGMTRRGEDVIKEEGPDSGRQPNEGTSGADRPHGTGTTRGSTGVDPKENISKDMPNMPPGDQGG